MTPIPLLDALDPMEKEATAGYFPFGTPFVVEVRASPGGNCDLRGVPMKPTAAQRRVLERETPALPGGLVRSAIFSPDMRYRYVLSRVWAPDLPSVVFVCLNPSTADESYDDPTNRRGVGFARRLGYGAVHFLNLFAFRATDPRDMKRQDDPVGPENDRLLLEYQRASDRTVAAWGVHGSHQQRAAVVLTLLTRGRVLHCLGTTKSGEPRHPLYLRADTPLELYPVGRAALKERTNDAAS